MLSWDPDDPPPHERALADALRDTAGIDSRFLGECLAAPAAGDRAGWEMTQLHDVARFDGIAQYWAAMVLERPVLTELRSLTEDEDRAVCDACEVALQPYIAADGTMRIPVTATMLRRSATGAD